MASLRHRGQRLGLVRRVRSRKMYPQSMQAEGSMTNRRFRSRTTDFTMCDK